MILVAVAGLLGAVFGSFIATLVVRWPEGRSAARGRSACDGCGAPIGSARLIPIISYAIQRGRAACCGGRINRVHPLAELLGAAIGALSVAVAPDPAQALAGAVLGWLLLTLALLDLRHFWLPNRVTAALALAGLAVGIADIPPPLIDRLIGGVAGLLVFAAVRYGYRRLRGREGMGGGDVKLFGAIGLWLGWRMLPLILFGAALAGLLWGLVLISRGQALTATSRLPFGVFLALAAWFGWLLMTAGWVG